MTPKSHTLGALTGLAAAAVTSSAFAAPIDVITTLAPLNATVGSGVRGVNALTTSQTWTKNNEYILTDKVFIPNGVTLTIEPGTKIYGVTSDPNNTPTNRADDKVGSLTAARGGRLIADGTAAEPIVFASLREWEVANNVDSPFDLDSDIGPAPTSADAGLWGGIVLLGNAYICHLDGTTGNNLGYAAIEGFVPASSPSDDGDLVPDAIQYGFASSGPFVRDDDDDSGVIRYVSIRNGGYEFDAGREINGLTLGGVGAGTVIDHVEVYANQDDGVEFFGGTVSTSHILLAFNQDDSFDFDSGHTGRHQFWFSIQDPGFADGGWEADGIEGTTATQAAYDAAFSGTLADKVVKAGITLAKPIVYNATMVGPGRSNTFSSIAQNFGKVLTEKGNHGLIFDDYFNGELYNSVIDDFSQDLLFLRDGSNKSTGATAAIAHNTIGRFGSAVNPQADTATAAGTLTGSGNIAVTVSGALVAGSPLAVGVPAVSGDTPAVWAGKVRAALAALPAITDNYNVAGSGTAIILATKVNAANDTSLNIALANGTATGVTAAPTSANTVVGGSSPSVDPLVNSSYITGSNTPNLVYNALTSAVLDNNSAANTNPGYTTYTRDSNNFLTAIDPRPAAGSPLLKSNGATLKSGAPVPVAYRGAFGRYNWAADWTKFSQSNVLQGPGELGGGSAPFADADNDGISDTLEATPALTALGFSVGVNNVSPTNLFEAIYTEDSILDLVAPNQVMVQKTGGNVTLSLELFRSTNLQVFTPAPALEATFPATEPAEFYRIEVPGAE